MINIAVLGCGTVGSGVVDVFFKNKESLERKAGQELDLKYILDVRDFPDSLYADRFVKDFNVILNDDSISIVVEVIGGARARPRIYPCLPRAGQERGHLQQGAGRAVRRGAVGHRPQPPCQLPL